MINTAKQVECQEYLGVGPYERSAERREYANGFTPKMLGKTLEVWHDQSLGMFHLFLDAHYEKVLQDKHIRDAAVLIATRVDLEGKRHILCI